MAGAFNLSEGLNLGILLKAMGHKVSFAQRDEVCLYGDSFQFHRSLRLQGTADANSMR